MGELSWSNELVLHVVELKTNGPAADLAPLPDLFSRDVRRINELLREMGGRLLPTAMHPWMDPKTETRLWPHEFSPVYEAYDLIFGCQGHGWSNLQSCHLNLPFDGDKEFARLHGAVRLVLPLLPALAASSPVVEGRLTGLLDSRLEAYRTNSRMIPEVAGEVIPEAVYSQGDYEAKILLPAYRAVAPQDPEGVLQDEFLNARGAIPRFGRGSLEIRLLDVQEHPGVDLAIVGLVSGVLKLLTEGAWSSPERQQTQAVEPLSRLFRRVLARGETAVVDDEEYLSLFGIAEPSATAREVWAYLAAETFGTGAAPGVFREPVELILEEGCLARRILHALDGDLSRENLRRIYERLASCLDEGEPFLP
jgi:gamma-glutamyl:cysteine ligase YbdK (ATP-grasp superfamily)